MLQQKDKVTIIGAGLVGATCAYALLAQGVVTEIALIDVNESRVKSEVMDLNHGIPFLSPAVVKVGDYNDVKDSIIVIICAGANQKVGQTRLDLLKTNVKITNDIVRQVIAVNSDCMILMVTNPVDILTYTVLKASNLPSKQVIGSGTVLDSARLRYLLGQHCNIDPGNVHAYVIGEHGDSEVCAWHSATIGGLSIDQYCLGCEKQGTCGMREKIEREIVQSAYEIIEGKGATYYAVGLAVSHIVRTIIRDENSILPISSLLTGQYGLSDLCLSVPTVLNAQGVERIIPIPLSDEEQERLHKSGKVIHDNIEQLLSL